MDNKLADRFPHKMETLAKRCVIFIVTHYITRGSIVLFSLGPPRQPSA
jgi:hypothetical protein